MKTSLGTLTRVLGVVNWHTITKDDPKEWLYFYEQFLEVYDNALRKRTGSYYTPPEVVSAMVNLVDEALRGPLFERSAGFAAADVIVADPAVGTGTFLLGVLRRIAETVKDGSRRRRGARRHRGRGQAHHRIRNPVRSVCRRATTADRRIADADEQAAAAGASAVHHRHARQSVHRRGEAWTDLRANRGVAARREQGQERANAITVVIGNPPYKEKAEGRGGWIEKGSGGKLVAPLDRWRPPPEWGVGAHLKHLKNLYVYFWRWATWKVFGSGNYAATGNPDKDEEGIVCFITVAGFLNGPGFEKMRDDLRRTCSEIWVIDCSPEGHQPDVPTRIFQAYSNRSASCSRHASSAKLPSNQHRYSFCPSQKVAVKKNSTNSKRSSWTDQSG